jgi:RNA polymerase I-specific transcription initiation factor RRN3
MGVEQGYEDMQGTFRDSEVFEFVGKVLQSVWMVQAFHPPQFVAV